MKEWARSSQRRDPQPLKAARSDARRHDQRVGDQGTSPEVTLEQAVELLRRRACRRRRAVKRAAGGAEDDSAQAVGRRRRSAHHGCGRIIAEELPARAAWPAASRGRGDVVEMPRRRPSHKTTGWTSGLSNSFRGDKPKTPSGCSTESAAARLARNARGRGAGPAGAAWPSTAIVSKGRHRRD